MKITHQVLNKVNFPKGVSINRQLLFFLLAIHFNSAIRRIESGMFLDNFESKEIDENSQYYFIARQITNVLSELISRDIPESEVYFIALIIYKLQTIKREVFPRVAVVVVSKGDKAEQMVKTAQDLLRTNHGTSLILDPQWKPEQCKAAIHQTIQAVDEGKGIIFLCDHSSARSFIKDVVTKVGIKAEIMSRVSTAIVVEAIRLAQEANLSLNDVANELIKMTPEGSSLEYVGPKIVSADDGLIYSLLK